MPAVFVMRTPRDPLVHVTFPELGDLSLTARHLLKSSRMRGFRIRGLLRVAYANPVHVGGVAHFGRPPARLW